MADEHGGGTNGNDMLLFVFGGFALLVALWFFTGGPSRADLRGIFLYPPNPLGTGEAHGPTINGTHSTTTNPQH